MCSAFLHAVSSDPAVAHSFTAFDTIQAAVVMLVTMHCLPFFYPLDRLKRISSKIWIGSLYCLSQAGKLCINLVWVCRFLWIFLPLGGLQQDSKEQILVKLKKSVHPANTMCPSHSYSALMHGFCACLLRLPLQSLLTPENCKAQAVNKVFQLFLLHFLFNDIRASLPTCFEHKKRSSHSYSCIFLYLTILPLDTQRRGFP